MAKSNEASWRHWVESGPLASVRRELEDLVDGFLDREKLSSRSGILVPRVDVSETAETVEVTAELPGVKSDQVEVELQENRLIITGEFPEEETLREQERTYHCTERRRGRFWRSVPLPATVTEGAVQAELHEGVLRVVLPKVEQTQRRRIPVQTHSTDEGHGAGGRRGDAAPSEV